ncbi:LLM class flavin-dependent oxidoreductase [Photorhabdus khanii]|uniref:Alkanal monooxygenase n=1 Tax=Photorhabdus khanii TaxID=1004150 RepID=A0A7C9GI20_9GAMM|nr:alkanal monooxygenase [Photorhabdus khanii]MQL47436.1 LLM class flavin-dependent oxidoreductase [Photorhabdus khanii]
MKFGLFFLNFINSTMVQEQSIARMQEITEYVDKLNFEQILLYENHFSGNGIVGAPLTVSGFLLGLTEKIKVGSLNHIITTHHPVRIAEEACLLDQLSEGRFILGFSDCEKKDEMHLFNRPDKYQQQLFEECYEIINDALTTGYCNPDNDFYSFPKISVNPHAYTQGGPRRYVTATSHYVVEWAAKKGIPLIFKWDDSNDVRHEYAERYKVIADKQGIDLSSIDHQLMILVNVNEDSQKAKEETRAFIRDYVLEMHPDENLEKKLEEIITENAVGDYMECIAAAKLAIEQCGAKTILLSFEPMNDLMSQKNAIDIVNDNIKKYHM